MVEWLRESDVSTVAMESTGVYWIPAYELLEKQGIVVKLVNARHVKNVSGRKTDISDCEWLQQLHSYGLLEGSFRPKEDVCAIRSVTRQRSMLIEYSSSHMLHVQKALNQMNVRLHEVVSNIMGATGVRILRAIVDGERDMLKLVALRDGNCKGTTEAFVEALQGNYREEHVFELRQALDLYEFYQRKILECDELIEKLTCSLRSKVDLKDNPLSPSRKRIRRHVRGQNVVSFDARTFLYEKAGIDLTEIDGISTTTALVVLTEIGFSVDAWKTSKQFCSWLGLSPNNQITGGKVIRTKTKPTDNRAAQALRMAATALFRSKTALGAYFRRLRTRLGAPKAITATAHKLARLIYAMFKNGSHYLDVGMEQFEHDHRERVVHNVRSRARDLGFVLVPATPAERSAAVGI